MNKKEIINYIVEAVKLQLSLQNQKVLSHISNYEKHLSLFPTKLYKYRSFDKYTKDSITNNYIFLCSANKLDDQFECKVNFDEALINKNGKIKKSFINEIINIVDELPSSYTKKELKKYINSCLNNKNNIDINKAIKNNNQNYSEDEKKDILNSFSILSTNVWKEQNTQKSLIELIKLTLNIRNSKGIGSLSEINNSQIMWEMYSNHYKGYCIEYDTSSNLNMKINTFPVIYGNKKDTDILNIIIGMIIEELVNQLSKGLINQIDKRIKFVYIFLTKYKEWSFQKEWRILGEKDTKFPAPPIKAIYLGKHCAKTNEKLILRLAKKYNFAVYKQFDNLKNLSIEFKLIK